jgi:Fe-S cluster assembly iron-binding protein IscA
MLVLTQQAVDAIRGIVEDSELGDGAGLRISGTGSANGETALEFDVAETALEGDEVVRESGAVVYLDETASALLSDMTLDVHAHGDHFHFSLEEQTAS